MRSIAKKKKKGINNNKRFDCRKKNPHLVYLFIYTK